MEKSKVILGLKAPSEFSLEERKLLYRNICGRVVKSGLYGKNIPVNQKNEADYYAGCDNWVMISPLNGVN